MIRRILCAAMAVAAVLPAVARQMSGQVDTINIVTTYVQSPSVATIVVPTSYLAEDGEKRYPVVYMLHGYGNDHSACAARMPLAEMADRYQVIFVCPDGRNSWYWDSPVVPQMKMESFIVNDLVPTVDERLRTVADRSNRAMTGFSMGGHGAMWLSMRHKDLFGSACTMSGGVNIAKPWFKDNWDMARWLGSLDDNKRRWDRHTAISLVPTLKPGELNLMLLCGYDDFFLDVNEEFHDALTRQGIRHDYHIAPGTHNWEYWCAILPEILDFFESAR